MRTVPDTPSVIPDDERFASPLAAETLPMSPNYRFDLPFHEARAEWRKSTRAEQIKYELMARAHFLNGPVTK